MVSGTLYVVATPIGNLSDITLRALEVLKSVQCIAAEDTRHTLKLLTHHQIRKSLTSYHSHNMAEKGPALLARLREGEDVALVTDAGTPGISDPGTLFIQQAVAQNIPVVAIPGPTASVASLVVSGLPTHPFAFLGFPPPKGGSRSQFFTRFTRLPMTLILYESAKRLSRTLSDVLNFWGDRRIAVVRELTKIHEEIFRGTVSEALERYAAPPRGEVTLVIAGADEDEGMKGEEDAEQWKHELQRLLTEPGKSTRDAVNLVAAGFRVPRHKVYEEALKITQNE
jgi:16S rRNA (cytidine1402-2'-O)-methyltransferase